MAEPPILIDSSIWIAGLDPRGAPSLHTKLIALIESGRARITEMIRLEVMGGARSVKEFESLRSDFLAVECFHLTENEWRLAEGLSFHLNRKGQRVPASDLLIASTALSYKAPLWHSDADFERVRSVRSDFHTYWHPRHAPDIA